ncbi:MAG: hypothetical protein RL391_1679, partial [Actinomycetota bacterium]
ASSVISVVSPKGGSGKTMIAVNLATVLAGPQSPFLIDLDVHFGDVEYALGMDPSFRLDGAVKRLAADPSLDATTLLSAHPAGFKVLCAPENPVIADRVSAPEAFTVVDRLMALDHPLVIDTAPGINEFSLGAMDRSSAVVLVCGTDVASVQAARKLLDTMREIGMDLDRVHLCLNRVMSRVGVSPSDVEAVLGRPAECSIAENINVAMSMNLGEPIVLTEPKSAAARSVCSLAGMVSGRNAGNGRSMGDTP